MQHKKAYLIHILQAVPGIFRQAPRPDTYRLQEAKPFLALELHCQKAGRCKPNMKIVIVLRLLLLAFLTFAVVTIMLPAMILGGSQFLREVYTVLEHEYARLRE